MNGLTLTPLPGIEEIDPGSDLGAALCAGIVRSGIELEPHDVLVVAQKIVSKAEGRSVELTSVQPSPRAIELASVTRKDPRLIELILAESTEVLRAKRDVLIVRHRLGYVMANAGIDLIQRGRRRPGPAFAARPRFLCDEFARDPRSPLWCRNRPDHFRQLRARLAQRRDQRSLGFGWPACLDRPSR